MSLSKDKDMTLTFIDRLEKKTTTPTKEVLSTTGKVKSPLMSCEDLKDTSSTVDGNIAIVKPNCKVTDSKDFDEFNFWSRNTDAVDDVDECFVDRKEQKMIHGGSQSCGRDVVFGETQVVTTDEDDVISELDAVVAAAELSENVEGAVNTTSSTRGYDDHDTGADDFIPGNCYAELQT